MPATVEIFHKGKRIAVHECLHEKGARSTNAQHMAQHHRQHLDRKHWLGRARAVGPQAERLAKAILDGREHPDTRPSWASSDLRMTMGRNA